MHDHSAGHSHSHIPNSRIRLYLALGITGTVFLAEVIGAAITGSLALAADAGHMLVDTSGLIIALLASILMSRPASDRRTWGYARSEVIAATLQAGMLFIVCLGIGIEGVERLFSPQPVEADLMLWFGIVGLLGNMLSIAVLLSHRKDNLNMKAAFLEVLVDTMGSFAVVIAALASAIGWHYADAIASLIIACMMAPRALSLMRTPLAILMEKTPEELDLAKVRKHILDVDHVIDVHDLHVSTIATGTVILTAHVTVGDECSTDGHSVRILRDLQECVAHHFEVSIEHATFQIEPAEIRDKETLHH